MRLDRQVRLPLIPAPGSVWLLAALLVVLLPAWLASGSAASWLTEKVDNPDGTYTEQRELYWGPIRGAMLSAWLPVAMGMLVTARAGGVDISVWGAASAGSVVAWGLIAGGMGVFPAVFVAMLVGAGGGLVQGVVSRLTRVKVHWITLGGGVGLMVLSRALYGWWRPERLQWDQLGLYSRMIVPGVLTSGQVLTLLLFMFALGVMLVYGVLVGRQRRRRRSPRSHLLPAMALGGALSAGAGCVLLLGQSHYVSHDILISNFAVLAAVLLCGAWLVPYQAGTLLSAMMLPLAMLAVEAWYLLVWTGGPLFGRPAYDPGLILLVAMILGVHSLSRRPGRRGPLAQWPSLLAMGGVALAASAAYARLTPWAAVIRWSGVAVCATGVIAGHAPHRRSGAAAPADLA